MGFVRDSEINQMGPLSKACIETAITLTVWLLVASLTMAFRMYIMSRILRQSLTTSVYMVLAFWYAVGTSVEP